MRCFKSKLLLLVLLSFCIFSGPVFSNTAQAESIQVDDDLYKDYLLTKRRINLHRAIEYYVKEYRLPNEELFVSILLVESSFNPCAVSSAGAAGLSQLMPATAESIGVSDPFDIHQSLWGGASTLKTALNISAGNVSKSLGIYNWGMKSLDTPYKLWPRETREYIQKVGENMKYLKAVGWKNSVPEYVDYASRLTCIKG